MSKSKVKTKSDVIKIPPSACFVESATIPVEQVLEYVEKNKSTIAEEKHWSPGRLFLNDKSHHDMVDGIKNELGVLLSQVGFDLRSPTEMLEMNNSKKYKAEVRLSYNVILDFDFEGVVTRLAKALGRDIFQLLIFGDKKLDEYFLGSIDGIKALSDKNHNIQDMDLILSNRVGIEIIHDKTAKEIVFEVTLYMGLEPNKEALDRHLKEKERQRENQSAIYNMQDMLEPFIRDESELIEDTLQRVIDSAAKSITIKDEE